MILDRDGLAVRVRRSRENGRYDLTFPNLARIAAFRTVLNEAKGRGSGYWADLFYNPEIETTFINYRRPLRKNGRFVGLIAAAVTIKDPSK